MPTVHFRESKTLSVPYVVKMLFVCVNLLNPVIISPYITTQTKIQINDTHVYAVCQFTVRTDP